MVTKLRLRYGGLGLGVGDYFAVPIRTRPVAAGSDEVLKVANSLLERYKEDFSHLAKR